MRSLSPYSRNSVLEKLEQSLQRIKKRSSLSSALDYDVEKEQFFYPKPSLNAFNIPERFPKLPNTLEKLLKPQMREYINEERHTKFSLRNRRFSWNIMEKEQQINQSDIIPIKEEVDIKRFNLPTLSIQRDKNTIPTIRQRNPLKEKSLNSDVKQKKKQQIQILRQEISDEKQPSFLSPPKKLQFLPQIKMNSSEENPQDAQMEQNNITPTLQKPFLLEKIQIKPLLIPNTIPELDIKKQFKDSFRTQALQPILEQTTEKNHTTREKRFDSIMNYKMENQLNELKLMLKNYEKYKMKSTKKQQKQVSFLL